MRWYEPVAAALAIGALCCGVSATAAAQDGGDPAAARALFAEARSLVNAGRAKEACPKFEESLRLDHGMGTQFNLADCWERIGRTASAWALFLDVAAAARSANQSDREALAQERARALEPRLSRLIVRVDDPAPDLEVRRDGIKLGPALFGTAVPVDPGAHELRASAPGATPWSQSVNVPATNGTVTVVIPRLERAPSAASPAEGADATSAESGASSETRENRAPDAGGVSGVVVGAIVTGVLAAGFAVTGVLYSAAHNEFDRANVAGESSRFDKRDRATTLGIVNVVLLSGTAIAGGVTVYLWLGAPAAESHATGFVDPAFRGLTLQGTL